MNILPVASLIIVVMITILIIGSILFSAFFGYDEISESESLRKDIMGDVK